jgi:hypothetical protein
MLSKLIEGWRTRVGIPFVNPNVFSVGTLLGMLREFESEESLPCGVTFLKNTSTILLFGFPCKFPCIPELIPSGFEFKFPEPVAPGVSCTIEDPGDSQTSDESSPPGPQPPQFSLASNPLHFGSGRVDALGWSAGRYVACSAVRISF